MPYCPRRGGTHQTVPCYDHSENEIDKLHIRIAELEAKKDAAYREERRHVCALLSLLVYDSDGEPLDQEAILGLCNDVEASISQPKG